MSNVPLADDDGEVTAENGNVLFFEQITDIPDPKFPLGQVGKRTYRERCEAMLKRGLLTINTLDMIESLAVADDMVDLAIKNKGKNFRAASELKRAAMLKLDKLDADKIIASPNQGESVFARFGFAKRARQRRHGQD